MHKWVILSAILFATLSGVLFGGSYASAASIYDDALRLIKPLFIPASGSGTGERNYSIDWYNEALEAAQLRCDSGFPGDGCEMVTDLENLLTDPDANWAVIYDTGFLGYRIIYSFDEDATTVFHETAVQITATTVKEIGAFAYRPGQNDQYVTPNKTRLTTSSMSSGSAQWISDPTRSVFLSTFPVTYPAGYEGDIIPDTYIAPISLSPDIELMEHHVNNWMIRLIDTNYVSYDPIPFRCDDGFLPYIEYDLYNNDTDPITKLDTGIIYAGEIFEFKSEDYGVETEYKFIGNYMCYDDTNNFAQQTTFYFTLSAEGTSTPSVPIETCYKETFPYFDMAGCMSVVGGLISNLSFGTINLPLWTIDKDSCHTLGTIGDWLNLEGTNRTICPQFSTQVRNIVTPFLTFVLGLTIMGALMNKSQRDTH